MPAAKWADPANWPGAKVEIWPIADLIPYARNARKHPPEQLRQIGASMKEFGFVIPVLAREDGTIIAGHGRVEAAELVGITEAPVIVARGWSEAQSRAYTLADNRLAETSEWDDDLLRLELADLRDDGFDLDIAGFDEKSLTAFLEPADDDAADDDDRPRLAERFGIAPFTVLNARDGWWQDRKRAWIALGIRSELGRGDASDG